MICVANMQITIKTIKFIYITYYYYLLFKMIQGALHYYIKYPRSYRHTCIQ
jgi:hypothetical protein